MTLPTPGINSERSKAQNSPIVTEASLVLGGLVIIGLTLHLYPAFEANYPSTSRSTLSAAAADRQIDSGRTYLNNHPDDYDAYVAISMAYFQKGPDFYIESMNALDKARALGATDDHLFFYAGVMYDALGLPDYAINEYSKYLRHHPSDYETRIRLANVFFRLKRYDEAQAIYKEAIRAWPKDPTAWFNYAVLNKEKGNYPLALNCLEEVAHLTGGLPEGGLFEEGEIYRLKGDENRALEFYQQELARRPDYVPALEATEAIMRARGDQKQSHTLRKRIAELKKQQAHALGASGTLPPAAPIAPIVPTIVKPLVPRVEVPAPKKPPVPAVIKPVVVKPAAVIAPKPLPVPPAPANVSPLLEPAQPVLKEPEKINSVISDTTAPIAPATLSSSTVH